MASSYPGAIDTLDPAPATLAGPVTHEELHEQLINAVLAIQNALGINPGLWTSFTPSLTQSGTVTKTVGYAKYTKIGKTVIAVARLAVTGSGTGANAIVMGLPVTAATATVIPIGSGWVNDASVPTNYVGTALQLTTTTVGIQGTGNGVLGAAEFTAALASGDVVGYSVQYEAA
jgi:hypothetical protein